MYKSGQFIYNETVIKTRQPRSHLIDLYSVDVQWRIQEFEGGLIWGSGVELPEAEQSGLADRPTSSPILPGN